jgi:hypothetical protein
VNQHVFEADEFEKFTQKVLDGEKIDINLFSQQK